MFSAGKISDWLLPSYSYLDSVVEESCGRFFGGENISDDWLLSYLNSVAEENVGRLFGGEKQALKGSGFSISGRVG